MTSDLRQRLRHALGASLKARDAGSVATLRATLAAIDNAEAVDSQAQSTDDHDGHQHFAGSSGGLGAAEVHRRVLTPADLEQIVRREIEEHRSAAATFDRAGRPDEGHRLRTEANMLADLLDDHR